MGKNHSVSNMGIILHGNRKCPYLTENKALVTLSSEHKSTCKLVRIMIHVVEIQGKCTDCISSINACLNC